MTLRTTGIRPRLVLTLCVLLALSACGGAPESQEAELRAWVETGHRLVEEKDRGELLDMISPDYHDARGNERADIENMLRLYFFRQHRIELLTRINAIRIIGDSAAELDLSVGMAGTNDGVLGVSADDYNFEMELIREDGDWLLIAGRWGEVGDDVR